jgi:class 3 adenylate cyclase
VNLPAGGPPIRLRWAFLEPALAAALLALALLMGGVITLDQWRLIGRPGPGFGLLENRQVGPGGAERGGLPPLAEVLRVDGRPVTTARDVWAEAERRAPGTPVRYTLRVDDQVVEREVPVRLVTARNFGRYLLDAALPGLVVLGLGAAVVFLRPRAPESRVFLAFCLISAVTSVGYADLLASHRFTRVTLALWSLAPANLAHLALTFPERLPILSRAPWLVAPPYALSLALGLWLQREFMGLDAPTGEWVAAYWALAMAGLIVALARTALAGSTPLVRQRARVLTGAFAVGYLLPVLGTATETALKVTVPGLNLIWKLTFVFPLAIAYAIVRYQLFDIRAVVRLGVIYSATTALLAAGYAALLTLLNLSLAHLELSVAPLLPAMAASLVVVLLGNPVYTRTHTLLDRLFFRDHRDAQRAIEALTETLTTELELPRVTALITATVERMFHPSRVELVLADEGGRPAGRAAADPALGEWLTGQRVPLTRQQVLAEHAPAAMRARALAALDDLGAEAVAPIRFRDRLAAVLVLGPKRADAPYTSEDLRLVRLLVNQAAVAIENARAYSALQAALRRLEILESIRTNLAKFVPRTVRDLIDDAPEAPALDKRDVDVTVLFVDVVGYTRLSERLDPATANRMIERYFGAFLDEILSRGGDVNETAGDGLMVIFQDAEPARHSRAAVAAARGIMARARQINADPASTWDPVQLRVGINSGTAALGVTKIEGAGGTRWTYTASGPVTNVAARLAALAEGDTILAGPETRRRLHGAFDFEDLGAHRLKNVEEPVAVSRLVTGETAP